MKGWDVLRRAARSFFLPLTGLLGLLFASTLSESAGLGLFFPLIEYVQRGEAFLDSASWRRVAPFLAAIGFAPSVGAFIAAIFAVISTALALRYLVFVRSAGITQDLIKSLRDRAFANILNSHLFHFFSSSSASFSQTIEDEVEYVGQALNFATVLVASALLVAVYAAFLFALSWKLALIVASLAALRYAIGSVFIRRLRRLGEAFGELRNRLKSRAIAVHQGIDVVKSFAAEKSELAGFQALTGEIAENANAVAKAQAGQHFVEGLLGDGLLCVLVYIAVSVLDIPGTRLLAFLFVITRIIPKVASINDARIRVAEYLSRVRLLPRALADEGLEPLRWGSRELPRFSDAIVFENVSLRYPGGEAPSVEGVSFSIARGETVALVGPSGSGKSTVARLLLRLFDPSSGLVKADGIPLPQLRREDWARLVSVVSQDTFVFDDTLENNVKYAAPACTDAQFREALRRARAEEFVAALPEKERTRLGERGVRLSGGQRQRIAIARAFLRDSPILVLDEATSAMDAATERGIQEALEDLSKDRTLLVIAHRFGTIKNADRIVVLDNGRVVESGTHEELMRQGPLYRRLHDLQTR